MALFKLIIGIVLLVAFSLLALVYLAFVIALFRMESIQNDEKNKK